MKIRPLNDRVIVKRVEEEKKTAEFAVVGVRSKPGAQKNELVPKPPEPQSMILYPGTPDIVNWARRRSRLSPLRSINPVLSIAIRPESIMLAALILSVANPGTGKNNGPACGLNKSRLP